MLALGFLIPRDGVTPPMAISSRAAGQRAWMERLERFEQSGGSVQQFCDLEGVSTASFYQWRRKLQPTRSFDNASVTQFVPMAGGGVKGGFRYGRTDDHGYEAIENKMHIHDWHATILHLLGLDHEQLTYWTQSRRGHHVGFLFYTIIS